MNPSDPEVGTIKSRLPSMHGVNKEDCKCDKVSIEELRINHYLGSTGDFVDKTRRYWQVKWLLGWGVMLSLSDSNARGCIHDTRVIAQRLSYDAASSHNYTTLSLYSILIARNSCSRIFVTVDLCALDPGRSGRSGRSVASAMQ